MPTSKIRNTKVSFKNGKNQTAESLIKHSFEPLFSAKDGKARLTFCGVEHSTIEWTEIDKKTKKQVKKEKPVMKLVFSCFDVTHESSENIAVTCEYRLSETNRLGQILAIMDYQFKKETVTVDADDEYGVQTKSTDPKEIFDFLRGQCGLVFKGNLTVAMRKNKTTGEKYEAKGLWDIDYKTLEPKLLKSGEQERDILASDITDEDFQNPDISMESDSD